MHMSSRIKFIDLCIYNIKTYTTKDQNEEEFNDKTEESDND